MYLLGVSGRGKKTHCVIGDEKGNVYAEGFGGPSNYQISGIEVTKNSIETAVNRALNKLNLSIRDITYCVLGLEGACYEGDFEILCETSQEVLRGVPFKLVNDSLIELRAGFEGNWGIISTCGSRFSTMGQTLDGKTELRNMSYEFGKLSGGNGKLIMKAIDRSFRGEEGIGISTKLQKEIPKLFELESMIEVVSRARIAQTIGEQADRIPQLVLDLAREGDEVAQQILIELGSDLGKVAASIIRSLGFQKEKVPIIMTGSLFIADTPLMMDSYRLEVHKAAPHGVFKILDKKPVLGAYYLALDYIK